MSADHHHHHHLVDVVAGKLLQNVTNFTATDWFQSAMPRNPLTGEPTVQVQSIAEQRAYSATP
jgi:hypothetical protein